VARFRAGVIGAVVAVLLFAAQGASASTNVSPRIVGGASTPNPGWIAYLDIVVDGGDSLCGAELISTSWVLTAAHCVTPDGSTVPVAPSAAHAWVGFNLLSESDTVAGSAVDQIVVDPDYDVATLDGDVALLHLTSPSSHEPVALAAPTDPAVGSVAAVLGWGVTDSVTQAISDFLQRVKAPILDPSQCGALETGYDATSKICAGGALVLAAGTMAVALIGTVDYGSADCGDGQPSVYQRVTSGPVAAFLDATAASAHVSAPQVATTGTTAALTATSGNLANPTYTWDLDGDGGFDDASGAAASVPMYAAPRSVAVRALGDSGEAAIRRLTIASRPGSVLVSAPAQATEGSTMRLPVTLPLGGGGVLMVKMTSPWNTGLGPGRADLTSDSRFIDAYIANDGMWHEPWTLKVALSTVPFDASLVLKSPSSLAVTVLDTDKPTLSVPRVRRRKSSRLAISIVPPGTGKVTVKAMRGKRVIMRKRVSVSGTKRRSIVLKFTTSQRRLLRGSAPKLKFRWTSTLVPGEVATRTVRAPRLIP
jgi:hypothetical protein